MRKSSLAAALVLTLTYAGSAAALPVWYADVQTADILGNRHADLTALKNPGSIGEMIANTHFENLGAGLGSGYVSTSAPLDVVHTFAPQGYSVGDVQYASVLVGVLDDFDFAYEAAELVIGADVIDSGNAFANLFSGNVTALITSVGDSLTLTVRATSGDFKVAFSALKVQFDGSALDSKPSPAIPEPSAALVFAAGLAIAGWRRRS